MITKHKLNMDLQIRTTPRINVVQCDTGSRAVELTLLASGVAWTPGVVDDVLLRYRKSDGTCGSYDALRDGTAAWTLEGNVLTVLLAEQMLTVPGVVEAQAVLMQQARCIATFCFQILVEADPSLGVVHSEDYVNWTAWSLNELDKRMQEAKDSGDFDGGTYVPEVSDTGVLSWTNSRDGQTTAGVDVVDLLAQKLGNNMFLEKSGGTMTGPIAMGGKKITNLGIPGSSGDAVNKGYVDSLMKCQTVMLSAAQWSAGQQTVSLSGVTASCAVFVSPAPVSYRVFASCGIRCIAQAAGELTFGCDSVPASAVQISVAVFL